MATGEYSHLASIQDNLVIPFSMTDRAAFPSYAHGASDIPLLGETIGENLRRTVQRVPAREALVVRSQAFRATYQGKFLTNRLCDPIPNTERQLWTS